MMISLDWKCVCVLENTLEQVYYLNLFSDGILFFLQNSLFVFLMFAVPVFYVLCGNPLHECSMPLCYVPSWQLFVRGSELCFPYRCSMVPTFPGTYVPRYL